MKSIFDLKKKSDENDIQYIWRTGQMKDNGQIDMTWSELSDIWNVELFDDESEYLKESALRKKYQNWKIFWNDVVSLQALKDDPVEDLREQRIELEKERVKLRTERGEISRLIREQARSEYMIDVIRDAILTGIEPFLEYNGCDARFSDNDLIVSLSDVHAGIQIDNFFNHYNENVLLNRFSNYLAKIEKIAKTHDAQNCYLVLGGDLLSGFIHTEIRIENNLNVIEQVKFVSSAISQFAMKLGEMFGNVYVYSVPGNHARAVANKKESLKNENLDFLIPFYMEAKLQNCSNIQICENTVEETIAMFNVRGKTVFATHGDKDTPKNVVQNMTMSYRIKPDIVMMGHRHTNALSTVYDTKVVESGCTSGSDTYCVEHRFRNEPEQVVLVVNAEDGIDCMYDVQVG